MTGPLAAVGAGLFFGIDSSELWRTDGTPGGGLQMTSVELGHGNQGILPFVSLGERLLFWAKDAEHGQELWSSDGSTAGTGMVADLVPGPGLARVSPYKLAVGDLLYFSMSHPDLGSVVVETDGSTAGTRTTDVRPGNDSDTISELALIGDLLVFRGLDPQVGGELWALDLALFRGGFEDGTTSAWSGTAPPP